jgi:hypothetical protein
MAQGVNHSTKWKEQGDGNIETNKKPEKPDVH